MKYSLRKFKRHLTFSNVVIAIGAFSALIYVFSYLFPITDNAFVVSNIRPVAAQVHGYVTNIYVKNGDTVKKGQKLFSVFAKPYQYAHEQQVAELNASKSRLAVAHKTFERDQQLVRTQQAGYNKLAEDTAKYQQAYQVGAVSLMTLQNSQQNAKAAQASWLAAQKQLELDKEAIHSAENEILAIMAKVKNAALDLNETTVYATSDGVVQNLYLSIGTPVNVNQPLFSFVDTSETYIQANFNETDLRNVQAGDKVLIYPRMYLGHKVFHGIIVSTYWAANRQITDSHSQLQTVINENEWVLLPQRMPVQIKITDPDPRNPLRVGTSAYVYVQTK